MKTGPATGPRLHPKTLRFQSINESIIIMWQCRGDHCCSIGVWWTSVKIFERTYAPPLQCHRTVCFLNYFKASTYVWCIGWTTDVGLNFPMGFVLRIGGKCYDMCNSEHFLRIHTVSHGIHTNGTRQYSYVLQMCQSELSEFRSLES